MIHTATGTRRLRSEASRLWETASAVADAPLLAAARSRWAALPADRQMQLAACLAECRRAEFTRQVRQVVSVVAGLKRRDHADGVEHLYNEPCVVFIVRRKLDDASLARNPRQRLPAELLTPATIDGIEQPVAVPCDVQSQDRLLGGEAQALTALRVDSSAAWSVGALAWLLEVGKQRFGLAPIHVLSPRPPADGLGRQSGAAGRLFTAQGGNVVPVGVALAQGRDFGGRLRPGAQASFDAQLADLGPAAAVRGLFGGLRLSAQRPWVRSESDLNALLAGGSAVEIHVPANNPGRPAGAALPLGAVRSTVEHDLVLTYDFSGGPRAITHRVLEFTVLFGETTLRGDSGCPVLLRHADDSLTFVGMHIAGNTERRVSFVIPAWRLLDAASYAAVQGSLPSGVLRLPAAP